MTVGSNPKVDLPQPQPSKRVVVIGAGVAGMTAAHELAERGYQVEVVEGAPDPYSLTPSQLQPTPQPLVGGMARTSWAQSPAPASQDPFQATRASASTPVSAPKMVALERDAVPPPVWAKIGVKDVSFGYALNVYNYCNERSLPVSIVLYVEKLKATPELLAATLAIAVLFLQQEGMKNVGPSDIAIIPVTDAMLTGCFQIAALTDRVPGEHGFRFFPSFYRHLFDTMKRIPVPEASLGSALVPGTTAEADSSRSVFDNLTSADAIRVGLPAVGGGPVRTFDIARRPIGSVEELRRFIANVLERAGYRGQDIYRLVTRYIEYMASSPERRTKEYETMSWSDFLGLDATRFSPYFITQVQSGSQALVAMSSDKNDARTIGTIAIALTLDQVRVGDYVDGTLQDPTSTALFWPWQNYLTSIGVRFTLARLVGFVGEGMAVRPIFGRPARWEEPDQPGPHAQVSVDPADYYVVTVPVNVFRGLFGADGKPAFTVGDAQAPLEMLTKERLLSANTLCLELDALERGVSESALSSEISESDDVGRYLNADWLNDPTANPDVGPLRYMTGIQFYFGADVKVIKGHTLCLDSVWGVSYLSQVQYWQDRQRGENGVRGVISAIFTKWTVPAAGKDGTAKTALQCTPEELAERVWLQIVAAWDSAHAGVLPQPKFFYIDESLTYDESQRQWTNQTPYLVNDVGTWEKRPGRRVGIADYEYQMQLGHTVFAGAFMRSATRLNTMEAANETGRRAVNAILARDGRPSSEACKLWNLDDYELPDFLALRDLDRRIAKRGGHNIIRSPLTESILRATPWDLIRLVLPSYPDPNVD